MSAPHHSGVAQSVEQAAVNRRVVGSSPTAGAIYGGPPKGGPPPVHRSPGRKRPGLFLESPSLRRLLRDLRRSRWSRPRARRDHARSRRRWSRGVLGSLSLRSGRERGGLVYSGARFVGGGLEGGFTAGWGHTSTQCAPREGAVSPSPTCTSVIIPESACSRMWQCIIQRPQSSGTMPTSTVSRPRSSTVSRK